MEVASYSTTERSFVIYMSLVVDMSVVRIDDAVGVSSQPRIFAALSTSPRRLEQLTYTKQQPAI